MLVTFFLYITIANTYMYLFENDAVQRFHSFIFH